MKKVRITINNLGGGGAEKVLIKLLEKLNFKYEIDLFLITKSGVYLEEVPKNIKIDYNFKELFSNNILARVKNSILARGKEKIYSKDKSFIYNLNKKKYDYEIAFLEGRSTEIVANSKNLSSKKIAWVHTDLIKRRLMSIEEERIIYSKFDEIICVSNHSRNSLLELYPEYENKTKVIYNPIDSEEILNKSLDKIEMNKDRVNLVTVGRLSDEKGYDLLLKAIKNLRDKNLNFKLYIVGTGPYEKFYKTYILENNLQNYVEMVGFQKNPYPYIKSADIFVSSSRYEGFPLVLAEAIVLKKPVIATKCTGPIEILDNGKYGILAEVEDVKSLELSLEKLILDENCRKYYSEMSKSRKELFNIKEVLEEVQNLIV
ncbi:glycosyltransferase [Cetobacterium sp.]|uniref:glycosyltransferase n=1 Tax=Cetobacterium sp. TaxID=2071632 RepID=UPI003F36FCB4